VAITLVATAFIANPALAQSDDEPSGTAVQITPYVWGPGFGGTIRPGTGAPNLKVDQGFGDLVKDIDAAFFFDALVKHDRLIGVVDLTHSSSSRDGLVPTGNPAAPAVAAEGSLRQTSLSALAGYRAVDQTNLSLDLLTGGRAWWIHAKVSAPSLALSTRAKVSFVDPVVAARLHVKASPRWSFLVYGDIGGFGAASDITTQAMATANLRIARHIWLSGGYRYQYVDYTSGNIRAKVALAGPLFGATFAF